MDEDGIGVGEKYPGSPTFFHVAAFAGDTTIVAFYLKQATADEQSVQSVSW